MKKSKNFSKGFKKGLENTIILLRAKNVIPELEMGATGGAGSDCYPYTICEVAPDLSYIMVQSDNHKCAPGFEYFGNQVYTYIRNLNATPEKYTLRKNGYYIREGAPKRAYWCSVHPGHRRYYQDPSF